MKDNTVTTFYGIGAIIALFLLIVYVAGKTFDVRYSGTTEMDSIRVLNSIIELDIRTIRAQNDTNWMYRDSTSYFRTKFLVKRESLWLCLERGR